MNSSPWAWNVMSHGVSHGINNFPWVTPRGLYEIPWDHGFALFDFLAEVFGNDRGTSVGVATGYRGNPRVSTTDDTAHVCQGC